MVQELGVHSLAHLQSLQGGYSKMAEGAGATWFCSVCTLQNLGVAAECLACGSPRSADLGGATVPFIIPEGSTSVYLCPESFDVALHSISLCLHAARTLLSAPVIRSGFALVRPPGHHASSETFGSYCLLNTVAVTARALLEDHARRSSLPKAPGGPGGPGSPQGAAAEGMRVLIVDWDVHHGDGTQALIDADPLLSTHCRFVSIHRHDEGFWPKSGRVHDGSPSIVNIPLRGKGFGDPDYLAVFEDVVIPLGLDFAPTLVIVSASFDCADGDALGRFKVSPEGFRCMTRLMQGLNVPTLLVLEGGYDVDAAQAEPHKALCDGVAASVQGLLEGPPLGPSCGPDMDDALNLDPSWRGRVRPETRRVIGEVQSRIADI